ncbi:hypothetical protein BGX38DRAFT_1157504 [Terfezia claveryi]|nr:hypothetical protein BGX38DRAFT_1157504 [Terfezia claveryi]
MQSPHHSIPQKGSGHSLIYRDRKRHKSKKYPIKSHNNSKDSIDFFLFIYLS